MLVWLSDWQVAEDRLLVAVGDTVEWRLYPVDAAWMTRLFADRVEIQWQVDTYGEAVDQPAYDVAGVVLGLQGVWSRRIPSEDGILPVPGGARLQEAADTSASWNGGVMPDVDLITEARYGYVVSLASQT